LTISSDPISHLINNNLQKPAQRISKNGKIHVSNKAWAVRITILVAISITVIFRIQQGITKQDPFAIYSTVLPIHIILVFAVAWILYKNPAKGRIGKDLVSVIIPIYNQKDMIEIVIDAIYRSTYKNIEVIAINDGSKDGTKEILDNLINKYHTLKVIHKENEGKRKAVASGFYKSKGEYLVMIDSDSVIDKNAIEEFMKTFDANTNVGSVAGQARIWNGQKNILTKLQSSWWDFFCNIHKACESAFNSVTCCSGCLSGYRRQSISDFMPYWIQTNDYQGADRELSAYAIATTSDVKDKMVQALLPSSSFSQKLRESTSRYDDSEDRALTANSLVTWKSLYVASAIVYSDSPENIKRFLNQQTRWKKGYLRTNFFLSTFFWRRRNPLISLIYYSDLMSTYTQPFINITILFYEPFILQNIWIPIAYIIGAALTGLVQGLDIKFRDPNARYWKYKPIMNLFGIFALSWLLFYALLTFKKNSWMTR
jgi:hyaluronan synthase